MVPQPFASDLWNVNIPQITDERPGTIVGKFQCLLVLLKQNAWTAFSFGYVKKQNPHNLQYVALSLPLIFITVYSSFLAFSLRRKLSKNNTVSVKTIFTFLTQKATSNS